MVASNALGIEPSHGSRTNSCITQMVKSIDNISPLKRKSFRPLPRMPGANNFKEFTKLRIEESLLATGQSGRKVNKHRRV